MTKSDDNLKTWLSDPSVEAFLGRTTSVRLAILLLLKTGEGSQAEIARRFCVSRQAVNRQMRLAREMFET